MIHTDVGLGLAVHEVQLITAADLFQVDIYSLFHIGGGSQTVVDGSGLGLTVEVQDSTVALIHAHLVGGGSSGVGHNSSGHIAGGGVVAGVVVTGVIIAGVVTAGAGGVQVGHIGIGDLAFGSSTDSHIGAVGAHVIDSAVDGGVQGVQLGVVSKDGLVAGGVGKVHVGAVSNNVNILLGRAVHEVQVVAALSGLQVNINALGEVGVGSAVVAAHSAGEVVGTFLGGLVQTQLVSYADLGGSGVGAVSQCGSIVSGNIGSQHELGNILGAAGHGAINVAGPGSADSLVSAVSTQEVLAGLDGGNVHAQCGVVGPVADNICAHNSAAADLTLVVGVVFHTDVGLGLAVHEVEAQALAGDSLDEDIHAFGAQGRGRQSAAGVVAGEVQSLLEGGLLDIQSVSGLFLQRTVVDITGALGPAVQVTLGAELQLAVVVLDDAGNSDGIGFADLVHAVADHAVALDLLAANQHGDSHIAVLIAIGSIYAVDLAGQSCQVRQLLTNSQLVGIGQDLILVRGGTLSNAAAANTVDHLAACVEFDGALVVLDNTGDGDQVIDGDLIYAGALHAVAQDGVLGIALNLDHNRNVAIVGIIGAVDLGDSTGQSCGVGQLGVFLQGVSSLQDLAGIGDGLNGIAFLHSIQSTTCVELDGAVVVLQSTGDSDDVADQQLVNAVALQAVAHDGHVLSAFHNDGDGDVLVFSAVNGVDRSDLTAQGGLIRQALAGSQLVSSLDNLCHIHSSRQDHIPGVGCGVTVLIGDGSGQGIGGGHFTGLVHINGNGAVFVDDDLDQILAQINGPNHSEGDACDTDDAVAVIVHGGGSGLFSILVDGTQILHCLFGGSAFRDKLRGFLGRLGGILDLLLAATACQHADQHEQHEDQC